MSINIQRCQEEPYCVYNPHCSHCVALSIGTLQASGVRMFKPVSVQPSSKPVTHPEAPVYVHMTVDTCPCINRISFCVERK